MSKFQKHKEIVDEKITGIVSPFLTYEILKMRDEFSLKLEELNNALELVDSFIEDASNNQVETLEPVMPSDEHLLDLIAPLIPHVQDGETPSDERLIELIKENLPPPPPAPILPKVIHGKDADEERVIKAVLKRIPKQEVKTIIKEIIKEKSAMGVSIEAFERLQKVVDEFKNKPSGYVHGGGDTVAAGSNITITTVNGRKVISSTGGGGNFSVMQPTGDVDGINTVFTFASAPSVIVVDEGRTMQKVQKDGITTNWTGTTVITLSIAPEFDIYGY